MYFNYISQRHVSVASATIIRWHTVLQRRLSVTERHQLSQLG